MSSIYVTEAAATLTGNGSADGTIAIASTTDFYPGAEAFLWCGTLAELALATKGTGALNTVVQARTRGDYGNAITVALTSRAPDAGGVIITETGNAVSISIETGVSTVANVETKIGTNSTLIQVKTTGTGATVLTVADIFSASALAGATTTSAQVMIASIVDATHLRVSARHAQGGGPNYGYYSATAFTTALGAKIFQEAGVVPLEHWSSIVKKDSAF